MRQRSIETQEREDAMSQETQQIWTKESIQGLIRTSDRAVVRAIKVLYARQTTEEQSSKSAITLNGRGFNKHDAPFLSDIAKKLPHYDDHMTPRQIAKARHMLTKYWRQLLEEVQAVKPLISEPAKSPISENAPSTISETAQAPATPQHSPMFAAGSF